MKNKLYLLIAIVFLLPAITEARTVTVTGKVVQKRDEPTPTVEAEIFTIELGGAVIKKVRNSSSLGFIIESSGKIPIYQNKGENAKGVKLGPGRYRVYPYLEPGKISDKVTLDLETQETGEWVTKGGRQNILKYKK